ncbi:hypothetical protein DMUE_3901 [Dictyocoela muelleri]|nr:hypothetical protein DMUE_3901 [Dictyocoela muelleri]
MQDNAHYIIDNLKAEIEKLREEVHVNKILISDAKRILEQMKTVTPHSNLNTILTSTPNAILTSDPNTIPASHLTGTSNNQLNPEIMEKLFFSALKKCNKCCQCHNNKPCPVILSTEFNDVCRKCTTFDELKSFLTNEYATFLLNIISNEANRNLCNLCEGCKLVASVKNNLNTLKAALDRHSLGSAFNLPADLNGILLSSLGNQSNNINPSLLTTLLQYFGNQNNTPNINQNQSTCPQFQTQPTCPLTGNQPVAFISPPTSSSCPLSSVQPAPTAFASATCPNTTVPAPATFSATQPKPRIVPPTYGIVPGVQPAASSAPNPPSAPAYGTSYGTGYN